MRKKFIFMAVFVLCAYALVYAAGEKFTAALSGKEEAPPVKTSASGMAVFMASADGKSIKYTLRVKDLTDVTGAHVHVGAPGVKGHPAAILFQGQKAGKTTGILARGTIKADDLMDTYKGNLQSFIADMTSGKLYVDVHTIANPNGEIRGQIKPSGK